MGRKYYQSFRMSKTREQIAAEFGISRRTLLRWLMKAGIELPGGLVAPRYQDMIYREFGYPKQSMAKEPENGLFTSYQKNRDQ